MKTFRNLDHGYSADKNYIFYEGQALKNSDPATFEIIDHNFVKDKNHIYFWGNIADDDYRIINNK